MNGRRMFWVRLAALVAAPLMLVRAARAQGQELLVDEGVDAGAAEVGAEAATASELQALREDFATLLQRVEKLESEKSTVTAPFIVQNAAKETICSIFTTEAGLAILTVGDDAKGRVSFGQVPGGTSALFKDTGGKDRVYIGALTTESQISVDDPKAIAVMGTSRNGETGFKVLAPDRTALVKLLAEQSGGAVKTFASDGKPISNLSIAADGRAQFLLGDEARAHAVLNADLGTGTAGLSVFDADSKQRAWIFSGEEYAMGLKDKEGNIAFSVGKSDAGVALKIGQEDKEHAHLGTDPGQGNAFLSMFNSENKRRAWISSDEIGPIGIQDAEGNWEFSVGKREGQTALYVGREDKALVQMGVLQDGSGSYVSLYDSTTTERAFFTASEDFTQMVLVDKTMKIELGSDKISGRSGLFLSKDEKNFGSIAFDEVDGARIRLANAVGEGTVALRGSDNGTGGTLLLSGPSGGSPFVEITATADSGGEMLLYDTSHKARVVVKGTTDAYFSLYGDNSTFTAMAGDRAVMQIADGAGTVLVEAYQNTDNVGIVAVGPAGNGAAATLGNMGLAASALVGK